MKKNSDPETRLQDSPTSEGNGRWKGFKIESLAVAAQEIANVTHQKQITEQMDDGQYHQNRINYYQRNGGRWRCAGRMVEFWENKLEEAKERLGELKLELATESKNVNGVELNAFTDKLMFLLGQSLQILVDDNLLQKHREE